MRRAALPINTTNIPSVFENHPLNDIKIVYAIIRGGDVTATLYFMDRSQTVICQDNLMNRRTASMVALLVLLGFLTASPADALTIHASDVVPTNIADNEHTTLQRTWVISSKEQLHKLHIQVPGPVFVDYDASLSAEENGLTSTNESVVAKIVIRGNASDLIELLDVVPLSESGAEEDGIEIHARNQDSEARGYLFTRVFVSERAALRELSSDSQADTVVGDGVLASTNTDLTEREKATNTTLLVAIIALAAIAIFSATRRFNRYQARRMYTPLP
ncbi:hypothetical protein FI667_g13488, partial [Globisporangium splendens]